MVQTLIVMSLLTWMPTVNHRRVDFGVQEETPYWLGVSVPPFEVVDITAVQNNNVLFSIGEGTHTFLYYVENDAPILFYENGVFVGEIVPEPNMFILFSLGVFLLKKKRNRCAMCMN